MVSPMKKFFKFSEKYLVGKYYEDSEV